MRDPVITASTLPPLAKGLPFLGNALNMRIDPLGYFVKLYHELGPVFRISIMGRSVTVMCGIEANRFLSRDGDTHFGSESLFGGMSRELGSDALLTALDGVPHRHQRKVQRRGFSREAFLSQLPANIDIIRTFAARWEPGSTIPVFPTMQRIVTDQLGVILCGRTCGDYFDDIWKLLNTNMKVHVLKTHPKLYLKHPAYLHAKQRSLDFSREILDWHRANPPLEREPILIDDLLSSTDENGSPYSDQTVLTAIVGGYFAGMDTVASTASFMLYSVLKVPGLLERLREEVDGVFDNGGLKAESLRQMPLLHNTAMETLRMYPVAPFSPRTVVQPFEFGGYQFAAGTEVFVGNAVTHALEEYFPNPEIFDIDRYDRADYLKTPQTFAPFALGAHTCLGAGIAEIQLMVLVATLVRLLDFSLDPVDTNVTIYANPIPNPGPKLSMKILGAHKSV